MIGTQRRSHKLFKEEWKSLKSQVLTTPEADLTPQLAVSTRLVQDLRTAEHPHVEYEHFGRINSGGGTKILAILFLMTAAAAELETGRKAK